MTQRQFGVLLAGLSPESLFRQVMANQPIEVRGQAAQSFIGTL